jgi:NHL repeat-containing protein
VLRAQAKRSSAANRDGSARGGSVFGRRDDATRGSFPGADGSSARRQRPARIALSLLAAVLALVFVPLVQAKEATKYFGSEEGSGSFGGELNFGFEDGEVEVNRTGVGVPQGTIYVVEPGNDRIQRFDKNGKFVSVWGKDVIASAVDERQRLVIDATSGTFSLTFDGVTTAPIPHGASAFQIDDFLDALSSIGGDANVAVTGGNQIDSERKSPFVITFQGALAATDLVQMTVDPSKLEGSAKVTTLADGDSTTSSTGTGFEICTIATECKAGVASGENGALDRPQSVAVDGDTGNLYVSDRDNRRVSVYDGQGNFIASFGWDVVESGPGNTGTEYEICKQAEGDVCGSGSAGAGVGQIGSGTDNGAFGIAVSQPDANASAGTVFLADSGNSRVNTYDLDGANPTSFGSPAQFAETQPRKIDIDSRGIVYASDSNNSGEIDRYDSLDANGGGVGFLESIPASANERQIVNFSDFFSSTLQDGDLFKLSCPNGGETSAIRFNGAPSFLSERISAALDASCGAGNFSVSTTSSPPPISAVIDFQGAFQLTDVPATVCTPLTGSGTCPVTTPIQGEIATLLDGSTEGLAVDPDSDGGGGDEDVLHVLRDRLVENTVVQQLGPTNEPGAATAPTADDARHGAGANFGGASGLSVDDASGRLLLSVRGNVANTGDAHRVYILDDPLPDPVVIFDPVTGKTDTTATFSATIDPKGGAIKCAFQFADNIGFAGADEVAAPGCSSFNPDGGFQSVSRKVTGLSPNAHYFVRLKVARTFDPSESSTSGYIEFDTESTPPVVSDIGAVEIADTSARLVGTIDPKNSATGYVFEYGTTPGLGSTTAPLNVGGGTTPITVSQVVGGLSKDTEYYFRLVATNASGTTQSATKTFHTRALPFPPSDPGNCPNGALRVEQGSTHLPDCFAYEMVSPPDKNQGSIGGRGAVGGDLMSAGFSRDGDAVAFCTVSVFGEPASQLTLTCAPYVSRRGANGWSTVNPLPPYCPSDPDSGVNGIGSTPRSVWLAPRSFDRYAMSTPEFASCAASPLLPGAPLESTNIYRGDLGTTPTSFDLLTPNQSTEVTQQQTFPAGGSEDLSHVVFGSFTNQTFDSPPEGDYYKLYDWEEEAHGDCTEASPDHDPGLGGCLSLVSEDPSGNAFAADSRLPSHHNHLITEPISSAVSASGDRIYFHSPITTDTDPMAAGRCTSAACDVYLREGDQTIDVSASECTTSCGIDSGADNFHWATPSGEKAFFHSCAKLTDESATGTSCDNRDLNRENNLKLYRWDRNAPLGSRLVDLTVDEEPSDGKQPEALHMVGASTDAGAEPASNAAPGNTVYFIAGGQIVAGAPTGAGMKLYRWRWNNGNPSVDYLAPYVSTWDNGTTVNDGNQVIRDPNFDNVHDRVTADGKYVVIQTTLPIDPASDRDSDADMYRWGEGDGWLCVSCQLPGAPSRGHASSYTPWLLYEAIGNELGGHVPEHTISDDGKRIFFTTPDALVPQDVNGESGCAKTRLAGDVGNAEFYECADIYEWHDGTVSLVSRGAGSGTFILMGATEDGRDVFFATPQRLLGWDVDTQFDIYVARSGGGFPEPAPQPPGCEGESCRGAGTSPPVAQGAGSAAFAGPGNPKPTVARKCPKSKRKVTRRGKVRCVKRSRRTANNNRRAGR